MLSVVATAWILEPEEKIPPCYLSNATQRNATQRNNRDGIIASIFSRRGKMDLDCEEQLEDKRNALPKFALFGKRKPHAQRFW